MNFDEIEWNPLDYMCRCTIEPIKNKRFEIRFDGYKHFVVVDVENERGIARMDTMSDAQGFLEMYEMFDDIIKELKHKMEEGGSQ